MVNDASCIACPANAHTEYDGSDNPHEDCECNRGYTKVAHRHSAIPSAVIHTNSRLEYHTARVEA